MKSSITTTTAKNGKTLYFLVDENGKKTRLSNAKAEEILALRLSVMHNLYFYNQLTARIRQALEDDSFEQFRAEYSRRLSQKI